MLDRIKFKKSDIYYLGLFIYVLSINIQYSYAHNIWVQNESFELNILKIMRYIAYILCITHFLIQNRVNKSTMIFGVLLLVAALYATHTGPQRGPIYYFILMVTAINTDFKKNVRVFLRIQMCCLILYILLSQLGKMGRDIIVESFGRTRSFLGYGWVNRASYALLFITLELFYLRNGRLRTFEILSVCLLDFYIYLKTDTVYSALMTAGLVVISLFIYLNDLLTRKKRPLSPKEIKRINTLCVLIFASIVIIGFILPIVYNGSNPVMYQLNKMVTGRLALGKKAIMRYGLHLGGSKVIWTGSSTLLFGLNQSNEYFYVDSGFLQLAIEFGLLFTLAVIYVYIRSLTKSLILRDYVLTICFLFLGILFIFEPYVIDFAFNPFVLFFFSTLNINKLKMKNIKWIDRKRKDTHSNHVNFLQ